MVGHPYGLGGVGVGFVDEHDAVLKVDLVPVRDLHRVPREGLIVHEHHAPLLVQVLEVYLLPTTHHHHTICT